MFQVSVLWLNIGFDKFQHSITRITLKNTRCCSDKLNAYKNNNLKNLKPYMEAENEHLERSVYS